METLKKELEDLGFKVVFTDKSEDLIGWTNVDCDTVFIDNISIYNKKSIEFNPILTCKNRFGTVLEFWISFSGFGFNWITNKNPKFYVEGLEDNRILPLIKLCTS